MYLLFTLPFFGWTVPREISLHSLLPGFSFFKKIIFLLKDNCFTEFCCFLSNLNMNQPSVYSYPILFEPPSVLPPHPSPLGWYRALVWVSWAMQQIPIGYLFYMWKCKFPRYSCPTSHPLLPSPRVHKSVLYVFSLFFLSHCYKANFVYKLY